MLLDLLRKPLKFNTVVTRTGANPRRSLPITKQNFGGGGKKTKTTVVVRKRRNPARTIVSRMRTTKQWTLRYARSAQRQFLSL